MAAQVAVAPDSGTVTTGTQPPSGPYREMGAVTATHGGGCGLYGSRGNYEGAYTLLRNKAATLGATYVQVLRVTEPHFVGPCFLNEYTIDGMAYRVEGSEAGGPSSARPGGAPPKPSGRQAARGTAFAVRPDGLLLTAYHVVEKASSIQVTCEGQQRFPGVVDQASPNNDLATIRVSGSTPGYLSIVGQATRPGTPVFTVGFPATEILGPGPKFTEGSISAPAGPGGEASLLQISVPIQPGNSGGPVVDDVGQVVGVVTSTAAVLTFVRATGALPQNVNWAVKAGYALPLFEQPPKREPAQNRPAAIERAMQAVCFVEATR